MANRHVSFPTENLPFWVDKMLIQIFKGTPFISKLRKYITLLLMISVWMLLALLFRNIGLVKDLELNIPFLFIYPKIMDIANYLHSLFSINTLLFMALIIIGYRLALQLTSAFLAHNFELDSENISRQYILRSTFSVSNKEMIELENGSLNTKKNQHSLIKLGGPAQVEIKAGNAAVFEKLDGTTEIIASAFDGKIQIEGFEKLRAGYDLRDQSTLFTIFCRTKDGIPIYIKDLRIIFNINGLANNFAAKDYIMPDLDAIYWATYKLPDVPWQRYFIDLFQKEFSKFVSTKKITEILVVKSGSECEMEKRKMDKHFENLLVNYSKNLLYQTTVAINIQHKSIKNNKTRKNRTNSQKYYLMRNRPENYFFHLTDLTDKCVLADDFFREFREIFHEETKLYSFHFDWIDHGTFLLPDSLNRQKMNSLLQKLIFQDKLIHSDLSAKISDWNESVYLSKMIRVYKKHIRYPSGKFVPPSEEKLNNLLHDYLLQIISQTVRYQKKIGKVPTKILNMINILQSYEQSNSNYFQN